MGTPEQALATVNKFIGISDVVKVSDEDIAWLTNGREIDEVVRDWLTAGPSLIVVTKGKEGAAAFTSNGVRRSIPAGDVKVEDTVGAGDSFMGGLIDALWSLGLVGAMSRPALRDLDAAKVDFILQRAATIGDITVSRAGANPPWLSELAEFLA